MPQACISTSLSRRRRSERAGEGWKPDAQARNDSVLPSLTRRASTRHNIGMPKPEPKPIDPADLPRLAQETMADAKFPVLATSDGDQPRARPVSPVRTDGFTVYVANLRMYHKTQEIAEDPKVELCYL